MMKMIYTGKPSMHTLRQLRVGQACDREKLGSFERRVAVTCGRRSGVGSAALRSTPATQHAIISKKDAVHELNRCAPKCCCCGTADFRTESA